jgi:hypothetical protein
LAASARSLSAAISPLVMVWLELFVERQPDLGLDRIFNHAFA